MPGDDVSDTGIFESISGRVRCSRAHNGSDLLLVVFIYD